MSLKEEINKQGFNRASVMADLVVPARFRPAALKSVERALACDRAWVALRAESVPASIRGHGTIVKKTTTSRVSALEKPSRYMHKSASLGSGLIAATR